MPTPESRYMTFYSIIMSNSRSLSSYTGQTTLSGYKVWLKYIKLAIAFIQRLKFNYNLNIAMNQILRQTELLPLWSHVW